MKPRTKKLKRPACFSINLGIFGLAKVYMLTAFACLSFFNTSFSHAQVLGPYNDVSYYIVAHQDDWQLFMGANAANDIISGEKVVLIYITAGDLDSGSLKPYGVDLCTHDPSPYANRTIPYYEIRETGATYSLHLMAENSALGWCFEPYPIVTTPDINNHNIRRYEYRNTVSYFLRIVDEEFHDMGWDHSRSANTIDGSTTYLDWCDLTITLAYILLEERVNEHTGWLNIPEIEESLNPFDHPSHRFAGHAAIYAVNYWLYENYPTSLYVGYDSQNRPPNLSVVDAANEAGMSAAYNLSLINHRIWNEWRGAGSVFQEWCARNYFRVENSEDIRLEYQPCRWYKQNERNNNPKQKDDSGLIYPNPSNSILTVDITGETDNNSKVIVYDMHRASVFEQKCEQNMPVQVNVANFEPGSYYVHIITKEGTTIQKAIILKK